MIQIQTDGLGQSYIEWAQIPNPDPDCYKRAWIQTREGDKDWAGTGRYLNVVRIDRNRPGLGGSPTDFRFFPIFLMLKFWRRSLPQSARLRDAGCLEIQNETQK